MKMSKLRRSKVVFSAFDVVCRNFVFDKTDLTFFHYNMIEITLIDAHNYSYVKCFPMTKIF